MRLECFENSKNGSRHSIDKELVLYPRLAVFATSSISAALSLSLLLLLPYSYPVLCCCLCHCLDIRCLYPLLLLLLGAPAEGNHHESDENVHQVVAICESACAVIAAWRRHVLSLEGEHGLICLVSDAAAARSETSFATNLEVVASKSVEIWTQDLFLDQSFRVLCDVYRSSPVETVCLRLSVSVSDCLSVSFSD